MDYRPSPHLRHFQNDKSQRPFIPPLSFLLPVSLYPSLSLPSASSPSHLMSLGFQL